MAEQRSSYGEIFKATSIFGGVQFINIIVTLIRAKFVAVLIGTTGYGINSLLQNPLSFITNLTSLGLNFSAVRDISAANSAGDQTRLSKTVITFRRWVWFTGLLGMAVVMLLSPVLSQWSFGNKSYTWAFLLLSVTLLFSAISGGQMAVLRGTRRIKDTALAGICGSVIGLFTTIPLYYFFGTAGIVPALLIAALTTLLLSFYFSRRVKIQEQDISYRESFEQGKEFVKLGIVMTANGLILNAVTFIISLFIRKMGGLDEVGLYNAGWSITNQYVGMVFSAMAVDYYPRLSALHADNDAVRKTVNEQAEIAILILSPLLLFMLLFLPVLVPLLLSQRFISIIPFVQWAVIGMMLKAASWSLGFILLAKKETKLYFCTELIANFLILSGTVAGYYFWGLQGVGIGFITWYLIYFLMLFVIARRKYGFSFQQMFVQAFGVGIICLLASLAAIRLLPGFWGYGLGGVLLLVSAVYSFRELNRRIGLIKIFKQRFGKTRK